MVFQNAGFTLALVIQTLILAAFLIIAIISLLARDTVQAIGENVKQNVTNLKSILVDVEMLSSSCTDPELKQALNKALPIPSSIQIRCPPLLSNLLSSVLCARFPELRVSIVTIKFLMHFRCARNLSCSMWSVIRNWLFLNK